MWFTMLRKSMMLALRLSALVFITLTVLPAAANAQSCAYWDQNTNVIYSGYGGVAIGH